MTRHAPPDTRLGRLQRGRGDGFLQALQEPRPARDEVLQCILHDPRVDVQVESRSRYYAELAVRLAVPAQPIIERATGDVGDWLCVDVLAEMAARGDADAAALLAEPLDRPEVTAGMLRYLRDYPTWTAANVPPAAIAAFAEHLHDSDELIADVEIYGEFWQPWSARMPRVADAFADCAAAAAAEAMAARTPVDDPTSLTLDGLLDHLDQTGSDRLSSELRRRNSNVDRDRLLRCAADDDAFGRVRAAACALADMGDLRLLDLAEELFAHGDDLDQADRQRRTALLWYFRTLPPEVTLPLARRWWQRGGFFRTASGRVLAHHAEPRDRDWLAAAVQQALARGNAADAIDELDALVHLRDRHTRPLFVQIAVATTFAWARTRALHGLAATLDDDAARGELTHALWDCEDEGRRLGCVHGAVDGAAARQRCGELARDPLEDDEVRAAAAARSFG